jgi:hypothetical protein
VEERDCVAYAAIHGKDTVGDSFERLGLTAETRDGGHRSAFPMRDER